MAAMRGHLVMVVGLLAIHLAVPAGSATTAGAVAQAGATTAGAVAQSGTNAGGASATNAGGASVTNAGGASATNAGGVSVTNAGGASATNAGGAQSGTNAGGASVTNAGGASATNAGGASVTNAGGASATNAGGASATNAGGAQSGTNAGGAQSGTNAGGAQSVTNAGGNQSGTNAGGGAQATTTTTTVIVTQSEVVKVTTQVGVADCATATQMIGDAGFKTGMVNTMANTSGVPAGNVDCALSSTCRRLQAGEWGPGSQAEISISTRRKLAAAAVNGAFTITVPQGSSATAISNSITQADPATFQASLVNNLAGTSFSNASLTVSSLGTPSTSVTLAGFTACYTGQACFFDMYAVDTHYVINSRATITLTQCGQNCVNTAGCEAFEHLNILNQPSCVLWKAGACNIPGGSPPGLVSGFPGVTTCERDGARSAFTAIASKSRRESALGVAAAVLCALSMGAMTG